MSTQMKPKLSVLCITYNHEPFIRQCLDGFVMQKTNFPFQVLIHDDASTDGTADIIREYAKKYPDIIKPVLQKQNQFSRGINVDKAFNWPRINGEYVALCEGDDYWTDPNKLQKQVDFLDAHPDYSVCFHPVRVVWADKSHPDSIFPTPKYRFNKTTLELSDLLKHNFIQTNSVVYRWALAGRESDYPDGILPGDWFMHLMHAATGKIGFLPDVMAVYRRHAGGIWWDYGRTDNWFLKCATKNMKFYAEQERMFGVNRTPEMTNLMRRTIAVFLRNHKFDEIVQIANEYPDVYQAATAATPVCPDAESTAHWHHRFNYLLVLTGVLIIILLGMIIWG